MRDGGAAPIYKVPQVPCSEVDNSVRLFPGENCVGFGSLGTLLVLYGVVKTWRAAGEWWVSHVGNVAIAVSAVSFSWFLLHWHLLHFSLLY